MSKIDAMRAMREAKYAERQARAGTPARRPATRPPVAPPVAATTPPATRAAARETAGTADEGLCGHRSINGRTCTRERGHSAKSHRYG